MVGENQHVGRLHIRLDGVGELLTARGLVLRDRDVAEEHLDLGEDALRDRLTGHGEGCGVGRMAVDDAVHVGPLLHDREMEEDLARTLPFAGDLVPLHVDDAQVGGLHEAL